MEVDYTGHALRRMRERGVSEEEVEATLASYDTEVPAENGLRHRYKTTEKGKVRVTFDSAGAEKYMVITVTRDEVER